MAVMEGGQTTRAASPGRLAYLFDREKVLGPTFLLPSVLYLAALVGFPLVLVFLYAFSDAITGSASFHLTGLRTFGETVRDPVFLLSLENTFLFTFASQAIVIVFSLVLAFALSAKFPGRWLVRFVILLPWTTPVALSAVLWLWMLDSQFSPLDWILASVGLIHHGTYITWLGITPLARGAIIGIQAWRLLPFATVIVMAGLASIPREIEEQSEIDGAGWWRRLFDITMPLLRPIVLVALLFGIVQTFTDMTAVFILTNGGNPGNTTQVLASWAFIKGINGGSLNDGAATALFMFPVLLGLSVLLLRLANRAEVA